MDLLGGRGWHGYVVAACSDRRAAIRSTRTRLLDRNAVALQSVGRFCRLQLTLGQGARMHAYSGARSASQCRVPAFRGLPPECGLPGGPISMLFQNETALGKGRVWMTPPFECLTRANSGAQHR